MRGCRLHIMAHIYFTITMINMAVYECDASHYNTSLLNIFIFCNIEI